MKHSFLDLDYYYKRKKTEARLGKASPRFYGKFAAELRHKPRSLILSAEFILHTRRTYFVPGTAPGLECISNQKKRGKENYAFRGLTLQQQIPKLQVLTINVKNVITGEISQFFFF